MKAFSIIVIILLMSLVSSLDADIYANTGVGSNTETSASGDSSLTLGLDEAVIADDIVSFEHDLNITYNSNSEMVVTMSNGNTITLMIDAQQARDTAETSLEITNCDEDSCRVEMREEKRNNEATVIYRVKTTKEAKVFGVFNSNMDVSADVDAQTGQVVSVKKPWWAFLAVESKTQASSGVNVD